MFSTLHAFSLKNLLRHNYYLHFTDVETEAQGVKCSRSHQWSWNQLSGCRKLLTAKPKSWKHIAACLPVSGPAQVVPTGT